MSGARIGKITHYFGKIGVAVISLTDTIKVGDTIRILGNTSDFEQKVTSLQIDHNQVESADAGTDVAMKVFQRVWKRDEVFKLEPETET